MGDGGSITLSGVIFLFSSTCHCTETRTRCATHTLGRGVVYFTYSQAVWARGIVYWNSAKGNCVSWYAEARGTGRRGEGQRTDLSQPKRLTKHRSIQECEVFFSLKQKNTTDFK